MRKGEGREEERMSGVCAHPCVGVCACVHTCQFTYVLVMCEGHTFVECNSLVLSALRGQSLGPGLMFQSELFLSFSPYPEYKQINPISFFLSTT